jgi:L,D-transpeptidase catalytic domain
MSEGFPDRDPYMPRQIVAVAARSLPIVTTRFRWIAVTALTMALSASTSPLAAQRSARDVRLAAARDTAMRILVSLRERRLRVLDGAHDTLLVAPVAVGSGGSVAYGGRRWTFDTPRGVHTVVSKDSAPIWVPPDWHYVEVARKEHLRIAWLRGDTTVVFDDGSRLIFEGGSARFVTDEGSDVFERGEHVVIDDILFVPPIGSENRKVPGELGRFRLSIGDGVGIHGTPDAGSIGNAVTHGCMRLSDPDIEWLYRHVPAGTHVYIDD